MATFEAQVEALTSFSIDGSSTPTQTELSQFLVDGVLDVTFKWLAVKPQDVEAFQRESSAIENNGDIDLKGTQIISVMREAGVDGSSDGSSAWMQCRKVPAHMQSRVVDADSLDFASKYNPVYTIIDSNEVHVYPTPDGTNDSFKVFFVNHIPKDQTNGADLAYSHSDIKYFPANKVYLVVLYASMQSLLAKMTSLNNSLPSDISLPAIPTAPTMNTTTISIPSFTAPDAFVLPVAPPGADIDFSEVPAAPGYVSPILSLGAAPTISNLSITAVPPAPPTLTSVTFSSIDSALDSLVPGFTTATISAASQYTGSAPGYSKPSLILGAAPPISNLTIRSVPPAVPASPNFTTPTIAATFISNSGAPPTYTAPVIGGDATELSALEDLDTDNTIDVHADQIEWDQWFATAAHFIEDEEDVELASAQLQKISAYLQTYSAAIQNQLNIFNDANVEYQAKVQEGIQQAQLDAQRTQQGVSLKLQKENQEYAASLQKFNAEVQAYQANVSKEVQEYQQNLAGDLQVWQTERQTDLQKYGSDIQNELNEFNKENVAYQSAIQESIQELQIANGVNLAKAQADLQVATSNKERDQQRQLQNATNDMQAIIQDNTRKLSLYQAESGQYKTNVDTEVQEYQQNLAGDIQVWQAERTTDLQKYGSDIQIEAARTGNEMGKYQAEIGKATQKYQAETGYDLGSYNAAVQSAGAKFTNDLQKNNTTFQSDMARFTTDLKETQQENQEKMGLYTAEVQKYSAELAGKAQEFTLSLQKDQADYQWVTAQYTTLKTQYDQAFAIAKPPAPQQR